MVASSQVYLAKKKHKKNIYGSRHFSKQDAEKKIMKRRSGNNMKMYSHQNCGTLDTQLILFVVVVVVLISSKIDALIFCVVELYFQGSKAVRFDGCRHLVANKTKQTIQKTA